MAYLGCHQAALEALTGLHSFLEDGFRKTLLLNSLRLLAEFISLQQ